MFRSQLVLACALAAIVTLGCRAQNPPPNASVERRIEVLVRSQFNVPSNYDVSLGGKTKSDIPGFDNLPVTFSHSGKQTTVTFLLSKDGNTLHDDFTYFADDGKASHLVYVYGRRGAGSGFAGDWVSRSGQVDSEIGLEIQPYGSGGLAFSSPGLGVALKVKFDGNDSPSAGPDAPPASTFSGRRVNQHSVELTNKSQIIQFEVSTDLKTLTISVRQAGDSELKNILVFDRE